MSLAVAADPTPIRIDQGGVARVGETRVRLASVLYLHHRGSTPEEIQESFPALSLSEVYGAIAYYLRHRSEVDGYLAEQEAEAERLRREVDERPDVKRLRARLLHEREQSS